MRLRESNAGDAGRLTLGDLGAKSGRNARDAIEASMWRQDPSSSWTLSNWAYFGVRQKLDRLAVIHAGRDLRL